MMHGGSRQSRGVSLLRSQTEPTTESGQGSDSDSKEASIGRKLSKQEELIASLGLGDVETEEEKAARIAKREAIVKAQESEKQSKTVLALVSVTVAFMQYTWQLTHPVTAIQLLSEMQQQSPPLSVIGKNGKPSVVDFWAPWCDNCKAAAPTLRQVEEEYSNKINFILINADEDTAWPYIEAFGVDAIPHMALVSSEGDVETALIGPVPASVLRGDFDALLENASKASSSPPDNKEASKQPLPYVMYDAFRTHPERGRVSFASESER
jgi:thiol-disulfide isomerase/thioredoxin